jgi:hypothetical protein
MAGKKRRIVVAGHARIRWLKTPKCAHQLQALKPSHALSCMLAAHISECERGNALDPTAYSVIVCLLAVIILRSVIVIGALGAGTVNRSDRRTSHTHTAHHVSCSSVISQPARACAHARRAPFAPSRPRFHTLFGPSPSPFFTFTVHCLHLHLFTRRSPFTPLLVELAFSAGRLGLGAALASR